MPAHIFLFVALLLLSMSDSCLAYSRGDSICRVGSSRPAQEPVACTTFSTTPPDKPLPMNPGLVYLLVDLCERQDKTDDSKLA